MPITTFNYADIPGQGDPMLDAIIPGLLKGMQLANLPKQQQQQFQANQIANQLAQLKLQNAPAQAQADLALKQAQVNNLPLQNQLNQARLGLLQAQTSNIPVENQIKQAMLAKQLQKLQQPSPAQQQFNLANLKSENNNWDQMIKAAQEDVNNSNTLQQYANEFSDAYDRSKYTGQRLGSIPSKGLFSLGGAPEQEADIAAQNMVASKLALMKGRFTNYGLKFLGSTKPDRNLVKEAKENQIGFINSGANRMKELLPFLNAARNSGMSSAQAKELWENYQQKLPFNEPRNIGKWEGFLNKSLPSNVINPQQQKNLINYGKLANASGIKTAISNISQDDLEFTAKKYGLTIDQVKQKLGI